MLTYGKEVGLKPLKPLYMCPHTTIHSYCYMCVLILPYIYGLGLCSAGFAAQELVLLLLCFLILLLLLYTRIYAWIPGGGSVWSLGDEVSQGFLAGSAGSAGSAGYSIHPEGLHDTSEYVSIRQHTSAYISIRQHTSADSCKRDTCEPQTQVSSLNRALIWP
jgi:hypothetical protein